jgi:fructose-1,6-bisphosphatase/inositol monophosphatase family enzyme
VRWLVDPVDGTRPALLGGAYGVCAGALLVERDEVVAAVGWVFVPTLPALYRGILAPGRSECTLNGRPIGCAVANGAELSRCYMAVGSDAHRSPFSHTQMKLSAPGATSVHLTRLVHPDSDVAATILSRYHGYDAAAALIVAAAGGCEVHVQAADGGWEDAMDPLRFLALLNADPAGWAPKALVGPPHVLRELRG